MKFEEIYIGQRVKIQYARPKHTMLSYYDAEGIVVCKDKDTHMVTVDFTNSEWTWGSNRVFYSWRLIDNDPPLIQLAKALNDS